MKIKQPRNVEPKSEFATRAFLRIEISAQGAGMRGKVHRLRLPHFGSHLGITLAVPDRATYKANLASSPT